MTFAEDEMPSDQEIIDVRRSPNLVLLLMNCRCCCLLVRPFGVICIRIIQVMVHQRNRLSHSGLGFIGSFDVP